MLLSYLTTFTMSLKKLDNNDKFTVGIIIIAFCSIILIAEIVHLIIDSYSGCKNIAIKLFRYCFKKKKKD